MKKLYTIILFVFVGVITNAQSPNWAWAKSAGGTDYDYGTGISTDASGNVLITGYFDSPTITFGTTTLTNAGTGIADIFVVKYDASGNVLWAKSAGGTDGDHGYGISTDANGNVLVTGYFNSLSISCVAPMLTGQTAELQIQVQGMGGDNATVVGDPNDILTFFDVYQLIF